MLSICLLHLDSQDWKSRTKTRQCCADVRSPCMAKKVIFQQGYAGRVQARKERRSASTTRTKSKGDPKTPSKTSEGETSAPGTDVEEFQFRFRQALQVSPVNQHTLQRPHFAEDVHKVYQVWPCRFILSPHHLLCMQTGKTNALHRQGYYGTSGLFAVNTTAAMGMVHASMAPADINSFLYSLTDSTPQHPENLERKFVGLFMEAHTRESCSDA